MPEPDYSLPPFPEPPEITPLVSPLARHWSIGEEDCKAILASDVKPAFLPHFNVWHKSNLLPKAYVQEWRAKVQAFDPTRQSCADALEMLFVRQGTFTLCLLRSTARPEERRTAMAACGMTKRNPRRDRENAQAGQRAALGRAVDAWLRGRLAWTRPRARKG